MTVGYDYSKYEGNSPSSPYYNEYEYSVYSQDKETQNIYVKYDWVVRDYDQGYFQYYHNELEYNNISKLNLVPQWTQDASGNWYRGKGVHTSSFGYMKEKVNGLDIQQTFTTSDTNKLVIGASWRESDVTAKGDNTYDEGIDNTSIFVSDTWEFTPTWTLNAGVRYDDHSHAGDDITMSAGLNKKLDEDSHIYFNWSEVFRAPTTDDLFYNGEMAGTSYNGNPDLKPETGETWTLGYATKLYDRTNFNINYFESDLDDAIDWDWKVNSVTGYTEGYAENIDKQKKRGMEITLNHELNDNVSVNASYTYLKVENKTAFSNGFERDRNYYPNVYRLGVNYKDGKWDSNVWLRSGSGCETNPDNSGNIRYLDNNFITVDMAITYKASDDFSIYAKAYNLFNEAYTDYVYATNGSYNSPAQSRRFIIGAEYTF